MSGIPQYCHCPKCGRVSAVVSNPGPLGNLSLILYHGKKISDTESVAAVMSGKADRLICPDCDKLNHRFLVVVTGELLPNSVGDMFCMESVLPK
jgi:hypothetical protein